MKLDYFLYIAEAEGITNVVNTKQARINAAIKELARIGCKYGVSVLNENSDAILAKYNLTNLTNKEINYIKREVEKRF